MKRVNVCLVVVAGVAWDQPRRRSRWRPSSPAIRRQRGRRSGSRLEGSFRRGMRLLKSMIVMAS